MKEEIEILRQELEKERAARLRAEKRFQENIRKELEYFELLESVNDLICKTTIDGKIIYANQIAENVLGAKRNDIIGKNILDFVPQNQKRQFFLTGARQFLEKNCVTQRELVIENTQNSPRWFSVIIQFTFENCAFCENRKKVSAEREVSITSSKNCHYKHCIIVAHEITDRKEAQLELTKSEKRYRELTNFLPEMICEVDSCGKLTYANQFAINKLGYTSNEVIGNEFEIFKIFAPEDQTKMMKNLPLVLQGKHFSNEYTAVRKNGEQFPVIVYTAPMYAHDTVVGIRGVMIDISERKQNETAIAKSLEQQELVSRILFNYNSTLDDFNVITNQSIRNIGEHTQASRVYICEDSTDGLHISNTFEWCNNGVESKIDRFTDVSYRQIPSLGLMLEENDIIYPENPSELPEDVKLFLGSEFVKSLIIFPLKNSGKTSGFIVLEDCSNKREWSQPEVQLLRTVSNVIADAFARHRLRTELVRSASENNGIIESIPDQILRLSASGRVLSYKTIKRDGVFLNLKDVVNQSVEAILNRELSDMFLAAINECLVIGHFKFDFKFLNWDDLEYYEARFVKMSDSEVLAIIRNVTETKEKEKELQIAKNKAEEASYAKSLFLANVSHEIRTPMNAILGFSEWLYDNIDNNLHKSYLHTILSSGRNLLTLINDLLDLSRIESGKMNLELKPVRCNVILNEIKKVLQRKIEEKNLAFNIYIDRSVPAFIYMDEIRFYQILFNLISNATKFTSVGYIYVSVYATKTSFDNHIDLIVNIEDSGIGIREDQKEKIFGAFTQQSGQSNRYYEGTGLGLAIVSGLLKKMNGEIDLKSKVGKGTTFTVSFRDVKVAEIPENMLYQDEHEYDLVLEPCKIFIVDDVKLNIAVLKRIINDDNVEFMEAYDGTQALDMIQFETPDLVFMDIRMPGLSGYDVTEIIKRNEKLKHIPIVAFTASTMKSEQERIDSLFDAYLEKPALKKDVAAILQRFLPFGHRTDGKNIQEKPELNGPLEHAADLPMIIDRLENDFLKKWERIKGDLIIFDIEEFSNRLAAFAQENSCVVLDYYCSALNGGLQTFDIELIQKEIAGFPELIEKLKAYAVE